MLGQCTANLIARSDKNANDLAQIARSSGFGNITAVLSRTAFAEQKAPRVLNFFMVHFNIPNNVMGSLIRAVRQNSDHEVRFAPIILFSKDLAFEDYLEFIRLGFDDVIMLPEKRDMLTSRLSGQLNHDIEYFQTADYFGPDRRRMEIEPPNGIQRAAVPHSHTRYLFRRDPLLGTRILRHEVHLPMVREKSKHNTSSGDAFASNWPTKRLK